MSASNLTKDLSDGPRLLTIKEARKAMGESAHYMSDSYVEELIYKLTALARFYIRSVPKVNILNSI